MNGATSVGNLSLVTTGEASITHLSGWPALGKDGERQRWFI